MGGYVTGSWSLLHGASRHRASPVFPPMALRTGEGDGEQTVHGVDCRNTLQDQSEVCKSSLFGSSFDASEGENLYPALIHSSFTVLQRESFANVISVSVTSPQTCLPSASRWEAPKAAGTSLSSTDSADPG